MTLVLTIAGLVVACVAAWLAFAPRRTAAKEVSADLFRLTRSTLSSERGALADRALEEQRHHQLGPAVPLLAPEGWSLPGPIPIGPDVVLRLREPQPQEGLDGARAQLLGYWPGMGKSQRLRSYSAAVEEYARPRTWFNGRSYRLVDVDISDGGGGRAGVSLTFVMANYFDGLDTSEALAYESALRSVREQRGLTKGTYRQWLGGPFDLSKRAAILGVNVLTIRRDGDRAGYFLHHRGGGLVASAMGATHVVPAGEFQPQADMIPVWTSDLDLWRTAMREYAEEMLGWKAASEQTGVTIDYGRDDPFAQLEQARSRGEVDVRLLAIGLDPLSWKPEACLVAIWQASAFDRIFHGMEADNDEGRLLVGTRTEHGSYLGIDFVESNVLQYAGRADTLPAGRACLALAWQWRSELGLS